MSESRHKYVYLQLKHFYFLLSLFTACARGAKKLHNSSYIAWRLVRVTTNYSQCLYSLRYRPILLKNMNYKPLMSGKFHYLDSSGIRAFGRNEPMVFGLGTLSVGIVFLSVLVSAIKMFLIRRAEALSMSLLSL